MSLLEFCKSVLKTGNSRQLAKRTARRRFLSGVGSQRRVLRLESLEDRMLLAAVIGATNVDSLVVDVDGDGLPDPGDTLQHTVTITNSGNMDATGVNLKDRKSVV